jgi:hypothetical protein
LHTPWPFVFFHEVKWDDEINYYCGSQISSVTHILSFFLYSIFSIIFVIYFTHLQTGNDDGLLLIHIESNSMCEVDALDYLCP